MSDDRSKSGKIICDEFDPLKWEGEFVHPKTLNATRTVGGRLFLAGVGKREGAKIMIVAPTAIDSEFQEGWRSPHGATNRTDPLLLKGDHGNIMRRQFEKAGLSLDDFYYTTICKWRLPVEFQKRPKPGHIDAGMELLHWEIETVKPDIIMCLGKAVFDGLMGGKFTLKEVEGGWFKKMIGGRTEIDNDGKKTQVGGHKVLLYPAIVPTASVKDPSLAEKIYLDAVEMRKALDEMRGVERVTYPEEYRTISNKAELEALVDELMPFKRFSIDNEWGGRNHRMGALRSHQLGWAPGKAAYIRFASPDVPAGTKLDKFGMAYTFDCSYEEAGKILSRLYLRDGVRFVGHQIAADLPWLQHWLKIDLYGRTEWDTLYGMQCISEYADGKLEILASKMTDLPRWDLDLLMWKKENPIGKDDGYGRVPDSILIPYGCRDVDGPFRMMPIQKMRLVQQGAAVYKYYVNEFMPFVTDGFTNFTVEGLPMDRAMMNELRDLFLWARKEGQRRLVDDITREAVTITRKFLGERANLGPDEIEEILEEAMVNITNLEHLAMLYQRAKDALKEPSDVARFDDLWQHLQVAPGFNIRSSDHMRRWLFKVKELTPLRSTGNKEAGRPSIAWEKVMAFEESKRATFVPSYDKNTLSAYASDKMIMQLLQLNLVGNVTKSFLRPSEFLVDEETGEEEEVMQGLHAWISDDERIHGQFSSTETGRPRSWNPNSLNLPSNVNAQINVAIVRLLTLAKEEGGELADGESDEQKGMPRRFAKYLKEKVIPLRACICVPPGFCLVESDYKTAEMRGLAYISGDERMIATMTEDDLSFGLYWPKGAAEPVPIRLNYARDSGITAENQNPAFRMALVSERKKISDLASGKDIPEGKTPAQVAMEVFDELKSNPKMPLVIVDEKAGLYVECKKLTVFDLMKKDGKLMHPGHDVHWELIEVVRGKPRETMDKKTDRGAGKVGNFSSAYGASPASLERKIYSDTGVKPPEGTGQALLDALEKKWPKAQQFLRDQELKPGEGKSVAYSGRIRHFPTHDPEMRVSRRNREAVLSAWGREARNFPMQHSVASVAARAANKLIRYYREHGMEARVIALLYDSIVTMCPLHERFIVQDLHQRFMCDETWEEYHGRRLNYPIDTEFNMRWSYRPKGEELNNLNDRNWRTQKPTLTEAVA